MLELNRNALWVAVRKDKATAALAAAARRMPWVQAAGRLEIQREQTSENLADLGKFGNTRETITRLAGQGTPGMQAILNEIAYLSWIFHGGETTETIVGPPEKVKHVFKPLPGAGFWSDWWQRIGETQVQREQYLQARISQLVYEAATANQFMRVTPTVMALDAGVIYDTDPVATMPVEDSLVYTHGEGSFKLDDVVHRGLSQFTLTLNEDLQPVPGDGVGLLDYLPGNAGATIGWTLQLDAQGLARYNEQVYGTASPAVGARPLKTLPPTVAYSNLLQLRDRDGELTGDEFAFSSDKITLQFPPAPQPAQGGGAAEVAFAGRLDPVPGEDLYELAITCDDAAYTLPT